MAEGLLRHMAGNRFEAASAGTYPTGLHPMAVKIMKEIGIDISTQQSKSVDSMISKNFDYIITVCDRARQSCPIFPASAVVLHWDLEDPAEVQGSEEVKRKAFLRVREQLTGLIKEFIKRDLR